MVVDDAPASRFESRCTEIHQQAERQIHQTKISEQLLGMNRHMPFCGFQFNRQSAVDEQINAKSFLQHDVLIADSDRLLPINLEVAIGERLCQKRLINALQQSRAEIDMQLVTAFHGDR